MSSSLRPLTPVLLVPGWSDTARTMRHCRHFLLASGWPDTLVATVDFGNRYGSNIEHAAEIDVAARQLCAHAAASAIAVVAHSMGGLALRCYLVNGGADQVHTAVFVATPHRGTWTAYLAWGAGGREMRPHSEFLRRLDEQPLPAHVRAHCIRTPFDTRVLPGSSAWLRGTHCHTVRLPTHPRMMRHHGTLRLIRELLLNDHRPTTR